MKMVNNIKKLISEGDTQEAIDAIQEILEGTNSKLLNQTYLLESQFKELQSKIRLGIQSEATELNRINMSLLSICDDIQDQKVKPKHTVVASEQSSMLQNPMVKYALIGLGVLLAIWLISTFIGGSPDENQPTLDNTEQTEEQPSQSQ